MQYKRAVFNLHCWYIFTRESIRRVTDEQACFTYSTDIHKTTTTRTANYQTYTIAFYNTDWKHNLYTDIVCLLWQITARPEDTQPRLLKVDVWDVTFSHSELSTDGTVWIRVLLTWRPSTACSPVSTKQDSISFFTDGHNTVALIITGEGESAKPLASFCSSHWIQAWPHLICTWYEDYDSSSDPAPSQTFIRN